MSRADPFIKKRAMTSYYAAKLSGRRLMACYELAPQRVKQYLEAEILYVLKQLRSTDTVLELGCGYGRVAFRLAEVAARVVGIDTAEESLDLAREMAGTDSRCEFLNMDAVNMRFPDEEFHAVVCIQNGICAFGVDQETLMREALRVSRKGGTVLFSTYSNRFWGDRLAWFEAQSEAGLVGPIDYEASRDGVIVCTDGFRAGRLTPEDFRHLASRVGYEPDITEVDGSSVFCRITKWVPHYTQKKSLK
ncbi:MAG: methyltransferase domain-containing protein [Deltaproteobacteria bacterium]|nr:methyltransferase domain-containing protein [Deltaproteobacteria bacterium]MBW2136121.1 methyltransferase domain-containing protein [Deltaproteobacteria bacterium]